MKKPNWLIGKVIKERNENIREEIQYKIASHSVSYQTKLMAIMDLERNQMKFLLHDPLAKSLPSVS